MTAERWMKMQRNVSIASGLMLSSFWLVYVPNFWWLGLLMLAYQGKNIWEGMKLDMADERAELIAARAGFLSQKLMLGAAILILALDRRYPLVGAWSVITVILVGSFSEMTFRKMLGAEERRASWSLLGAIILASTLTLAACLAWAMWRIS